MNGVNPDEIAIGSVLSRPKAFIRHRGVYLGNGQVFENTPGAGERVASFEDFAQGREVAVDRVSRISLRELYMRVRQSVDARRPYNLFTNNCDHAVSRVIDGEPKSPQLVGWGTAAALLALLFLP